MDVTWLYIFQLTFTCPLKNATGQNVLYKVLGHSLKMVKVSYYIAQYSILWTSLSLLHFISLADQFSQTPSQLIWEATSHAAINARRLQELKR